MAPVHRLVPGFILENYAARRMNGGIQAAALFVDITGFTSITDTLLDHGPHGSEVLARLIRSAFRPLIETTAAFGGFVAIQAGDALMAVFEEKPGEAPAAERAIAAAQHMQAAAAASEIQQTPYGNFNISLKIGVARGKVRWGIIESDNRRRAAYYFMGPVVDRSSAAEHAAAAGEILVDDPVRAALGTQEKIERCGAFYRLTGPVEGLPAPGPVEEEPLALALAARFFPKELYTQHQGGEFRQVVHVFISLPTVRTDDRLAAFMESCFELMDRYGGLLNRLDFGDKGAHLLMFWGAPTAHENDITRALLFVLGLQRRSAIPINAGVTYQIAHAGFIGSELKEEYTAFGRGVNLAARFMTAAPRGEVWVDAAVAQAARDQFVIEQEREVSFKGFRTPQKAFTVIERREAAAPDYRNRMVGRDAELAALEDFTAPIFENRFAGAALVLGDAGIGKTRLLHEFSRHLDETRSGTYQIFRGKCDEIVREPLNPIRFWLRDYFQYSDFQIEARNKRNFNQRMDALILSTDDPMLAEELDRTRSVIGALLGLSWPDSLYEQLNAQERYENTLAGLTSLIRSESRKTPTIFFLEDIHWMDQDTRRFLQQLLRTLSTGEEARNPIAIVCTGRPVRSYELDEDQAFFKVELRNLSGTSVSDLSQEVLSGPVSSDLLALVNRKSEGNPLFAEQTLYYMRENGLIHRQNEKWLLSQDAGAAIPGDLFRLLTSRLDRLPAELKDAAQIAAVLGREFDENLFGRMLDTPGKAREILKNGRRAGIWNATVQASHQFSHALLWEVVYRMQLRERRRELHAQALAASEELYGNHLRTRYGELAHHAAEARLYDKAVHYLRKAGDAAREGFQNNLAEDYYTQALAFTPDTDLQTRFDLLLVRQEVSRMRGNNERRAKDLTKMSQIAELIAKPEARAVVSFNQAKLAFDLDDVEGAIDQVRKALAAAEIAKDQGTLISGYMLYSQALMRQEQVEEGEAIARKGLDIARKQGDLLNESLLGNSLGMLMIAKGDYRQAGKFLESSLQIAQELNDLNLRSLALNNLGRLASFEGAYSQAKEYYEQALNLARTIGNRKNIGIFLGNLGWLASVLGDYSLAREYLRQQLEIAREVGNRFSEAYCLINLSATEIAVGAYVNGLDFAIEGGAVADAIGERPGRAWAHNYAGHSLAGMGRFAEAEEEFQAALDIWRALGQPVLATEPLCGLALIALDRGDLAQARDYTAEVEAHLADGGTLEGTDNPVRVLFSCYRVREAYEPGSGGELLEKTYRELMARTETIADPETRRSYLEDIPLHQQIVEAWNAHLA